MAKYEEEIKLKFKFPKYSDQELKELNGLFERNYNGLKTPKDIENWMTDEGAIKNGNIVITGHHLEKNKVGEWYPVCDYPSKYALLQDKMEKANELLRRKEYGIQKHLEELEKTAVEKMTDIIPPHDPEITTDAHLRRLILNLVLEYYTIAE